MTISMGSDTESLPVTVGNLVDYFHSLLVDNSLTKWSQLSPTFNTYTSLQNFQQCFHVEWAKVWTSIWHFPIWLQYMKSKYLNTQRSFNDGLLLDPCLSWWRFRPTTDHVGVLCIRLTPTETVKAPNFVEGHASFSMQLTCCMIVWLACLMSSFDWGVQGKVVSSSIPSDFRYSANFLEVYSLPPSVRNRFTCLPNSLSLTAFHSFNCSMASNMYLTIDSTTWLRVSSMKSSIYGQHPIAVSRGPHMSECTSYRGSVSWEVVGVKWFLVMFYLMQPKQWHMQVILGPSVIVCKISNHLRLRCAKRRGHKVLFSTASWDACSGISGSSRQLCM